MTILEQRNEKAMRESNDEIASFNNDIDNTIIKFHKAMNINRLLLAAITLWVLFLTIIGGLTNPITLIFIAPIALSIHAIKSTEISIQTIRGFKL